MATSVISISGLTTLCYCGARAGEYTQAARASQSSHQRPARESFLERKRSKRAKVDAAIRNASAPIGTAASLTSAMVTILMYKIYSIPAQKVNNKERGRRAVVKTEGRTGKVKTDIEMSREKKDLIVRECAIKMMSPRYGRLLSTLQPFKYCACTRSS